MPSKSSLLVKLILMASVVSLASTQEVTSGATEYFNIRYQRCGSHLSDFIRTACRHLGGVYEPNHIIHHKRMGGPMIKGRRLPSVMADRGNSFFPTWRKKRTSRGIVHECCDNSCSLRFIQRNYCRMFPNEVTQSEHFRQLTDSMPAGTLPAVTATMATTTTTTPLLAHGSIYNLITQPHDRVQIFSDDFYPHHVTHNSEVKRHHYDIY